MFFEISDFTLSNVSAFIVSRERSSGDSGVRPYHALSFRKTGDAEFSFNKGSIHAGEGDIVFVPAYCQYHISTGSENLLIIHFNTDKPIANEIKKFSSKSQWVYLELFNKIETICAKKEIGYEHESKSILYKIIMHIEREFESQKADGRNAEIQKILGYIQQNYSDPTLSVQRLAESCFMSETYFRKLFKEYCGCSPLDYINQCRLNYAIDLLKTKYYTVAEVSELCGFSTPYYFSSFIKKKTGYSPIYFINNESLYKKV